MVVLQLASSQFSPRVLRTFFGDRVTQLTIGTFVGTFVYALLVLRAVGSFGDPGFVPRLSITLASLLGIAAVVLLVVFLNHVSRMIQVSHVTAGIAHATLKRLDALYPRSYGEPVEDQDADVLLEAWRAQPGGEVWHERPGYVQRIGVEDLAAALAGRVEAAVVLVRPGDFVGVEMPIAEVWPREAADRCGGALRDAVAVASERDLVQDVDFGVRQLADTAIKALSPAINDPMTAVTCIRYLRSILVRLTERATPTPVRRFHQHQVTIVVAERPFADYLESMLQIDRYVAGDAWVTGELLAALAACADAARRCGAHGRLAVVHDVAATVMERAREAVVTEHDRAMIDRVAGRIDAG
jgi:uncharacterized membrane protein